MIIGAQKIKIRIEGALSLKEKRRIIKSIKDKASKFNAAIAEVEDNDKWQVATIGTAFVSNDATHVNSMMDKFLESIQNNLDIEVIGSTMEIVHI